MRVCLIGAGRMGKRHLQAALNLGFVIAGVYDQNEDVAREALLTYKLDGGLIYDSARLMLESVRPDALVVASTATSHREYVCLGAELGVKYILCEKPMATSIEDCDKMIQACRDSGSKLAINHQMRFSGQYEAVKRLINTDLFGGLHSIIIAGSNFGLAMVAPHYFEMFRYLMEEEIKTVSFWADENKLKNPRGPHYEDISGQFFARSQSGKRLFIELGFDLGHGIQIIFNCRLGKIIMDELTGFMRYIHRLPEVSEQATTRYGLDEISVIEQLDSGDVIKPTEEVWRRLLSGSSYPDGGNGRHAVSVLVAANCSAELNGQPVDILDVPQDRLFSWA